MFRYRKRRDPTDAERRATVADVVELEEQIDYLLHFEALPHTGLLANAAEIGGEWLDSQLLLLRFSNFIGSARLGGVRLQVVSQKISIEGVSRLLAEVSSLSAHLIFGWNSPTSFAGRAARSGVAPVPFHQIQLLRHNMLEQLPGDRLQDWLAIVERNPVRRFEPERPVVQLHRARQLDARAVRSMFSHVDRLVPVDGTSVAGQSALAQALVFGASRQPHLAERVAAPRSRLSYDTPENRFVKHVLTEALRLTQRFASHPSLHPSLRQDCAAMAAQLEGHSTKPFIAESARLRALGTPSQVLLKAEGYRDIYAFWERFSRHVAYPAQADEVERLLQGRDIATLYEYWVFIQVLHATICESGGTIVVPLQTSTSELGESLRLGIRSVVGDSIEVQYNPSFTRSSGTAYSTPLRPDVIVSVGGAHFAFDAKYRLDRLDAAEDDTDDGLSTYKRADLYKMHTYRDAIHGLRAAFIVYPGTEFVFFERSGQVRRDVGEIERVDGVGAIPLSPSADDPAAILRTVIKSLLTPNPPG